MSQPDLPFIESDARSGWVRLRTLILLRWLALGGQTVAVLVASLGLGMRIPHLPVTLVIGALAVFNLAAMAVAARKRQLSEREALLTLLFDLGQLGALLYLTGGLANPFALLIVAPVTIGASVLSLRAAVTLAVAAGAIISLLAVASVPIELPSGEALALPEALALGSWAALMTGTAFLAVYARRVSGEAFDMSQALAATQLALAREQQLSALGGVVAAAAHELGTPLATIKIAASELVDELADRPNLQEDALLVRTQAERCSRILHAMGPHGNAKGREDAMLLFAPISSVVEEAAAPHADRGIRIITRVEGAPLEEGPEVQPELARQPEIIQGLRNLVQNAVDFAASTVWIDLEWSETELRVEIGDDGPGYPPELIGRIGEPFLGRRAPAQAERPGYEGMGLGLFIAKTLLERSGARLVFRNGRPEECAGPADFARATGAIVTVTWPRARVSRPAGGRQG